MVSRSASSEQNRLEYKKKKRKLRKKNCSNEFLRALDKKAVLFCDPTSVTVKKDFFHIYKVVERPRLLL